MSMSHLWRCLAVTNILESDEKDKRFRHLYQKRFLSLAPSVLLWPQNSIMSHTLFYFAVVWFGKTSSFISYKKKHLWLVVFLTFIHSLWKLLTPWATPTLWSSTWLIFILTILLFLRFSSPTNTALFVFCVLYKYAKLCSVCLCILPNPCDAG